MTIFKHERAQDIYASDIRPRGVVMNDMQRNMVWTAPWGIWQVARMFVKARDKWLYWIHGPTAVERKYHKDVSESYAKGFAAGQESERAHNLREGQRLMRQLCDKDPEFKERFGR